MTKDKIFDTYVYVSAIPPEMTPGVVRSPLRNKEIMATKNPAQKMGKYYAWLILEFAIAESFGVEVSTLDFKKGSDGRWFCDGIEFSISHTDGAVAVAISKAPVGVDIEAIDEKNRDGVAKKYLSATEFCEYVSLDGKDKNEYFLSKWTGKEAYFKSLHMREFHPSKIQPAKDELTTDFVILSDRKYVVSVASKSRNIVFFTK